ncbi:MAG: hypothetical protein M3336_07145, partial [Chloroflexota bacterium]|nr:hypothetical protein [Chloroflexota bacterium]
MSMAIELDAYSAARALGQAYFNLLRRGADGSLKLSADHWRLAWRTPEAFHFSAREENVPTLMLRIDQITRLTWD